MTNRDRKPILPAGLRRSLYPTLLLVALVLILHLLSEALLLDPLLRFWQIVKEGLSSFDYVPAP